MMAAKKAAQKAAKKKAAQQAAKKVGEALKVGQALAAQNARKAAKSTPTNSLITDASHIYHNAVQAEAKLRAKLKTAISAPGAAHPHKVQELKQKVAAAKRRVLVDKAGLNVVKR